MSGAAEAQLTEAQREALKWFRDHGGTGIWLRTRVFLAGGELAPHTLATFNRLVDLGLIRRNGRRLETP